MIANTPLNISNQTLLAGGNESTLGFENSLQQSLQSLSTFKSSDPLIKHLLQLIQSLVSQLDKSPQQSEQSNLKQENPLSGRDKSEKNPQEKLSSAELLAKQEDAFRQKLDSLRPENLFLKQERPEKEPQGNLSSAERLAKQEDAFRQKLESFSQENPFLKQEKLEGGAQSQEVISFKELIGRQKEGFQQQIKDLGGDQLGPNDILGTAGDDTINGSHNNDSIYARSGDDRVYGRQGNDGLLGQQGNDKLYGGQGNDHLDGGQGNDYLSGGSGNNSLFGGDGDDTLYHRRGTADVFDGGSGNDLARIRANIDDYSVKVVKADPSVTGPESTSNLDENPAIGQTDNPTIILTNKKTGQTVEATNIERFKFNDANLSLDEMVKRAGTTTPPEEEKEVNIKLTPNEQEGVFNVFGLSVARGNIDAGVRVIDKDGSGTISVGDTAILSSGGHESAVSQEFKELTAADVAAINNVAVPLVFNESEVAAIRKHVSPTHRPSTSFHNSVNYNVSIADNDGSGKVSAGDTLTLISTSKGTEGDVISEPVILTSSQADGINKNIDDRKELTENKAKWENSGVKDYIISGHYEPRGGFLGGGDTGLQLPLEKEPDIIVKDGEVKNPRVGSFTVDDAFKALENNNFSSASYNEQYGYPESTSLPTYDNRPVPSINISLLDKYRGESVGERGRDAGNTHGPSYRIDNFQALRLSDDGFPQGFLGEGSIFGAR